MDTGMIEYTYRTYNKIGGWNVRDKCYYNSDISNQIGHLFKE